MSRIKSISDVNRGLAVLINQDPDLGRASDFVKTAGIEVPLRLRPGGFGGLAEIVISQLVSKASANAIHQRFVQAISPLTPQNWLEAGEETWRAIGLSRPKQAAISAIGIGIIEGELDLASLEHLPVEEAVSHLTAIKGIGPWTAQIYLLFCVGHCDIFPAGDLALREAARVIWSLDERPREADLNSIAARWSPWRGVAARLLWSFYAAQKGGRQTMP